MTERMTLDQFRAAAAGQGGKKQPRVKGAQRTDGFDSKLESNRHKNLCLLQQAGHISDLKTQVNIPLMGAHGPILTPTGRQMHYRADFTYLDASGALVVEDAKGMETEVFLIKRAILAAQGITIKITKRPRRSPDGTGVWTENDYSDLRNKIAGEDQ